LDIIEETTIDPYKNKYNIDPYILVDVLNALSDKFSDGTPMYSDTSAENINAERAKFNRVNEASEEMFRERQITSQLIKNIENLPVNITIQDPVTFEVYARNFGAWCEEKNSPTNIKNVDNITAGMKDHFLRAIGIKTTII
jgi:hypothetical protein